MEGQIVSFLGASPHLRGVGLSGVPAFAFIPSRKSASEQALRLAPTIPCARFASANTGILLLFPRIQEPDLSNPIFFLFRHFSTLS